MEDPDMIRFLALAYGVVCYAIFFATFLYTVGFLGNFGVPKSIDSGTAGALLPALLVNIGLLVVFALQHSGMARPGFKALLTRVVPKPLERSTYVLLSSVALIVLFWLWQPLPETVWRVENPVARGALFGLLFLGVGLVLYSSFLIDHFDLFGLRQVVLLWKNASYTEKRFVTPAVYRFIRHPLYVGWFVTFWATPDMTVGHLLFASVTSLYILAAIPLEERDLAAQLGEPYRRWREATPAFIPGVRSASPRPEGQASQTG
jgi:protein-S-isoprenylcysteine O-methyltransferase Ste14